jgi:hypothetical protein
MTRARRWYGLACLLGCILAIQGCAWFSKPVPLKYALGSMESDLAGTGVVNASDAINNPDAFNTAAEYSQCLFNSYDPPVAVMDKGTKLSLKGQFSDSGKGSVSGIPGPTGGPEFTVTTGQEQDIDFPVHFVALSRIPEVYMSDRLDYLKALKDLNFDLDYAKSQYKLYKSRQQAIQNDVDSLVRKYPDSATCSKLLSQPRLIITPSFR